MLLSTYNKPRLTLKEMCNAIGMSINTALNRRSTNTLPIPMTGDPLHADIRDVAAYVDELRAAGKKPVENSLSSTIIARGINDRGDHCRFSGAGRGPEKAWPKAYRESAHWLLAASQTTREIGG
jgi:hypothetical protein